MGYISSQIGETLQRFINAIIVIAWSQFGERCNFISTKLALSKFEEWDSPLKPVIFASNLTGADDVIFVTSPDMISC